MAFGRHWEWRGFGTLDGDVLRRIEALPLLFPTAQELTDRYLWFPGIAINLKLREGSFKIKRRLAAGPRGLEEWLEDEAENFSFPLERGALAAATDALALPRGALDAADGLVAQEDDLLERLAPLRPDVRVVAVRKRRWQHSTADGVIVELAEITVPERISSLSIEDPSSRKVLSTLEGLDLGASLKPRSYLEALEVWGKGKKLRG